MASKMSSRSRGGASVKANSRETGPKLEENLNIFNSDIFDAVAFVNSKCNSLNEKVTDERGLRFCMNNWHKRVAYLDTDVGQPEFLPLLDVSPSL
ncbi:hypothetical protein LXL04_038403 [Taraxacum kok-saghyz]